MKSPGLKIILPVIVLTSLLLVEACVYSNTYTPSQTEDQSGTSRFPVSVRQPDVEPVITEEGFSVYNNVQPLYYGADSNNTVVLYNNETAQNPTWQELKEFLISDRTDENNYLPGLRVCAEFAAELHNNAEKAGIRAGWVAIHFADDSVGHALNVFETIDAGLVFIDSTGGMAIIQTSTISEDSFATDNNQGGCSGSHDKKAYVQIGKPLGVIGLDVYALFDYEAYIEYTNNWKMLESRMELIEIMINRYEEHLELHNQRSIKYKTQLAGRTVIEDNAEYQKLMDMYGELEQMRSELEEERILLNREVNRINSDIENLGKCRREPLSEVKSVEIYW